MTDAPLPLPHPLDEPASALLDAGADAPAGDPALAERLAELRGLRAALADVPEPDPTRRERTLAAALAAFDDDRSARGTTSAPVVPIERARRAGGGPRRWLPAVAAAAVLAVAVVGATRLGLRSDSASTESAGSLAAPASGAAAEADRSAFDAAGGAATTASATATAAAAATTAAAASGGGAATTTSASATSTAKAAAPTVGAPPALPYLGDVGSSAELDRLAAALVAEAPTATSATTALAVDDGVGVRDRFAGTACALEPYGRVLALLRWQGQPAVLTVGEQVVRVIGLDDCAVLVVRPLGG